MSFLDSIVDDMKSMGDGTWKEKVVPKRKEPPKPDIEEDNWEKDLERYEKKRRLEKQKQQEDDVKRKRDDAKRKSTNKEVMNEMAIMFGKPVQPTKKKGSVDLGELPFIDNVVKCKEACNELSKFPIIAVDCEWAGPRDALRSQHLCLVQIADPKKKVYLFDVFVAGKKLFDKGGLKGLLENPGIIKIFHDCRWDSDILCHQMGVRLSNVFDTQVGYACFRRQQERLTPLPVGLKNLLKTFALGGTHTSKDEARQGMENEQDYWKTRPMTEVMMQYAREDVLLLPLVYRQITAIYSQSSRSVAAKNSELYVIQRRDKTIEELEKMFAEERSHQVEGERPVPKYGIPEWDRAASVSLQRKSNLTKNKK